MTATLLGGCTSVEDLCGSVEEAAFKIAGSTIQPEFKDDVATALLDPKKPTPDSTLNPSMGTLFSTVMLGSELTVDKSAHWKELLEKGPKLDLMAIVSDAASMFAQSLTVTLATLSGTGGKGGLSREEALGLIRDYFFETGITFADGATIARTPSTSIDADSCLRDLTRAAVLRGQGRALDAGVQAVMAKYGSGTPLGAAFGEKMLRWMRGFGSRAESEVSSAVEAAFARAAPKNDPILTATVGAYVGAVARIKVESAFLKLLLGHQGP